MATAALSTQEARYDFALSPRRRRAGLTGAVPRVRPGNELPFPSLERKRGADAGSRTRKAPPYTHGSGTGGFRSETRVMQGTGQEAGLSHEESSSLELSGRWTGAHAKATALGAGALENCPATCHRFTQVPLLRGEYPSTVLHQGPWLHVRFLLKSQGSSLGISPRDCSLLSTLGWSLHPGSGLQFRILTARSGSAKEKWRDRQFPGGESVPEVMKENPSSRGTLDGLGRFPRVSKAVRR